MKQFILPLALIASTGLTACAGFEPMNATPAAVTTFGNMGVELMEGRDENDRAAGFLIRQRLLDRINVTDRPDYTLMIKPGQRRIGLGLTGQDFATRFDGLVTADWVLIRRSDGEEVASGRTQRTATYSADGDPYQLLTTSDAAVQRASREVADDIVTELARRLEDDLTR